VGGRDNRSFGREMGSDVERGGGSMHWKVGVNTVKSLNFEKMWVHDSPASYGGTATTLKGHCRHLDVSVVTALNNWERLLASTIESLTIVTNLLKKCKIMLTTFRRLYLNVLLF